MSGSGWSPASGSVDRGEADEAVRAAMASAYDGGLAYARAVAALCTARLILPTVDAPDEAEPGVSKRDASASDHQHGDGHVHAEAGVGHAERAAVLLRSSSGQKAVLAFTGYDALHAWRPDAHPVRCTLDDVAATVNEAEATSIVIDLAGPFPLVIEHDLIAELAQGHRLAQLDDGAFAWVWLDSTAE